MQATRAVLLATLAVGCGDKEHTPEELCAGEGDVAVALGHGTGAEFTAFEDGEDVDIAIAPQGGYGVNVRVQTLGLVANDIVTLVLSSSHRGEATGTFDWGEIPLYCLEDGHGLMWGAVVPFDPEIFPTVEDLAVLDGEPIHMAVEITDSRGEVGSGGADVVVHMPEQ